MYVPKLSGKASLTVASDQGDGSVIMPETTDKEESFFWIQYTL